MWLIVFEWCCFFFSPFLFVITVWDDHLKCGYLLRCNTPLFYHMARVTLLRRRRERERQPTSRGVCFARTELFIIAICLLLSNCSVADTRGEPDKRRREWQEGTGMMIITFFFVCVVCSFRFLKSNCAIISFSPLFLSRWGPYVEEHVTSFFFLFCFLPSCVDINVWLRSVFHSFFFFFLFPPFRLCVNIVLAFLLLLLLLLSLFSPRVFPTCVLLFWRSSSIPQVNTRQSLVFSSFFFFLSFPFSFGYLKIVSLMWGGKKKLLCFSS